MSLTGFFALPRSLAGSDSSAAVLKMTGTPIPCGLAGSDSSATVFSSPIEALTILRPFDGPAEPWLSGHRGVDLAAAPNAAVLAPGPGVVTFAGWVVDRGVLTIQHPGGLRSSFEPVVDQVEVGSQVHAGQLIARVDPNINHCTNHAGSAEQVSCLHWGVRDGDTYLDPLLLITERPRVALLPDAK
jgi:murein DD-endopeptidase MepM/ murein hydrolase activator NlpD